MCVSYKPLNAVTKPFHFPIPRCDDDIVILGIPDSEIWIISLDARQGYHQISVRKTDREKLVFFALMTVNIASMSCRLAQPMHHHSIPQ